MADTAFTVNSGQIPEVNLSGTNALRTPAAGSATQGVQNRGSKKTLYRYPTARLDNSMDYLKIEVLKFQAPKFSLTQFSGNNVNFDLQEISSIRKTVLSTILLPIPAAVSDSNYASWGEDRLGPLEIFGLGAATNVIAAKNPIEGISGIINSITNTGKSLLNNGNAQKAVQSYFAGAAVAAAGNTSGLGVVTRATGAVLNNNQELLFQGPTIRSFEFTFDFAPRDPKEGQEVKDIIRIFKQSMAAKRNAPQSVQGLFLGPPEVFQLTYKSGNQNHPFLNRFKQCALTNMQVNYNASGAYSTYSDGTPVHMQMSLSFQELNPIYAEDYDKGIGRDGVGY
jgi:hypothetical protein